MLDRLLCLCSDISPNESHHAAGMFGLLLSGLNFVSHLPADRFRLFRQSVITLIMATDMSVHFAIISNLRSRGMGLATSGDAILLMQAAFKCADLGHTFSPLIKHISSSKALQEEMFREGDRWLELGWSPPSLMDRAAAKEFPSSQLGFFRYVVIPFLEALVPALPQARGFLDAARENAAFWASQVPGQATPMTRRALSLPTRSRASAAAPASQRRSQELPSLGQLFPHAEAPPSLPQPDMPVA